MFRKLITALIALTFVNSAYAQTKPADVPDYVPVAATYDASGNNVVGDGSNVRGGPMPVLAKQPDDIPTLDRRWLGNGAAFTTPTNLTLEEVKSRFISNPAHIANDDPVRNYGQPGSSHCHTFFGSTSTNAFSTYASLRNRANEASAKGKVASTFAGGPINATGYWFPCVQISNPFGTGINYAVKPYRMIIYYADNPGTNAQYNSRLPRGLRYVMGVNMDDPDDCGAKNEVDIANGGTGTTCTVKSGIYKGPRNGFNGWKCVNQAGTELYLADGVTKYSRSFVNADGSDPWAGQCTTGMTLMASADAPRCYDGNNLWAPGGYKHFRYQITLSQNGNAVVCPKGWWRVPVLEITFAFKHQGFDDYKRWRLSSDDMAAATAGHPMLSGSSFHTDWMNGWDDEVFIGWQRFCNGADGAAPHTCDNSTVSETQHLIGGYAGENAPDGTRSPQVDQNSNQYDTLSADKMYQLPDQSKGPITIHAMPKN